MRSLTPSRSIRRQVGIEVCGSLGCLTREQLLRLREAGVTRYQHNLETSRRFFPYIVTTHTFDDRVRTVRDAKALGFSVCSGGHYRHGRNARRSHQHGADAARIERGCRADQRLDAHPGHPVGGC